MASEVMNPTATAGTLPIIKEVPNSYDYFVGSGNEPVSLYNAQLLLDTADAAINEVEEAMEVARFINATVNNHQEQTKRGRNLIEVFDSRFHNITTNQQVFERIHDICNSTNVATTPDFSLIQLGDYLELGQVAKRHANNYNPTYTTDTSQFYDARNTRISVVGFDHWLNCGIATAGQHATQVQKHHVMWGFDNVVTKRRYDPNNNNTVTYYNSELWKWLNGVNSLTYNSSILACQITSEGADASFKKDMEGHIPDEFLLRTVCSVDAAWVPEYYHIATFAEIKIDSMMFNLYDGNRHTNRWNTNRRFPLYAAGSGYLNKSFNGALHWWWTSSKGPSTQRPCINAEDFFNRSAEASTNTAGGVSPFFSTC